MLPMLFAAALAMCSSKFIIRSPRSFFDSLDDEKINTTEKKRAVSRLIQGTPAESIKFSSEGESMKAALILMKNSKSDRTLRYLFQINFILILWFSDTLYPLKGMGMCRQLTHQFPQPLGRSYLTTWCVI